MGTTTSAGGFLAGSLASSADVSIGNNGNSLSALLSGEIQTTSARELVCPDCSAKLVSQEELDEHAQSCSKSKLSPISPSTSELSHACTECDQKFERVTQLRYHIGQAHRGQWVCSEPRCNRICSSKHFLEIHEQRHKEKPNACTHPGCNRRFKYMVQLLEHLDAHAAAAIRYPCTFPGCGRTFQLVKWAEAHIKSHSANSNSNSFACTHPGCNKR